MISVNPKNGKLIQVYNDYNDEEIEDILNKSKTAFSIWKEYSINSRSKLLDHLAVQLEEKKEEFAEFITNEMGKTFASAIAEIEKCAMVCNYYASKSEEFLKDVKIQTDFNSSFVKFQPLGTILAIMPWNFPFWQVFRFAAPTLMSGNVCLLKHSSNVSGCALAIEKLFQNVGFPNDIFRTLLIPSSKVDKIIHDSRVAAVSITGSESAGSSVGASCGKSIKKFVLELGGNDPFIVMPSSDIDEAVKAAVSSRVLNNGQSCIAAKRFIIHKDIYEEFLSKLNYEFSKLIVGDPMNETTDIGPLAKSEFVDELHNQVVETISQGGKLICGGFKIFGDGYYYSPTIISDVESNMTIFKEETFGPVAAVIKADSIEDSISIANNSKFGLGASAWSLESNEQNLLIEKIESGSVFINSMVKSNQNLPFGGIKASGVGRELGSYGLMEFVNVKTIVIE
ncbi:MAG: NAD-dependent succinate-semialdehyde dehydrogenase [Chlorobiota bacterium]|nr:MAG: NAD-dependent succinate-semialdehyde dehydrogenase [Chlorobiota bacterium]